MDGPLQRLGGAQPESVGQQLHLNSHKISFYRYFQVLPSKLTYFNPLHTMHADTRAMWASRVSWQVCPQAYSWTRASQWVWVMDMKARTRLGRAQKPETVRRSGSWPCPLTQPSSTGGSKWRRPRGQRTERGSSCKLVTHPLNMLPARLNPLSLSLIYTCPPQTRLRRNTPQQNRQKSSCGCNEKLTGYVAVNTNPLLPTSSNASLQYISSAFKSKSCTQGKNTRFIRWLWNMMVRWDLLIDCGSLTFLQERNKSS